MAGNGPEKPDDSEDSDFDISFYLAGFENPQFPVPDAPPTASSDPTPSSNMDIDIPVRPQVQQPLVQDDEPTSYAYVSSSTFVEAIDPASYFSILSVEGAQHNPFDGFLRKKRSKQLAKVRKDFFRSQHIRAFKKSIRQHQKNTFPTHSIHQISPYNLRQIGLWKNMKKYYDQYRRELLPISATQAGPLTEGKSLRMTVDEEEDKTCSDRFCRRFYSSRATRVYNYLFCELVFSGTPAEMCAKMHILCCEGQHQGTCVEKWNKLKEFMRQGLMTELGIEMGREELAEIERFSN